VAFRARGGPPFARAAFRDLDDCLYPLWPRRGKPDESPGWLAGAKAVAGPPIIGGDKLADRIVLAGYPLEAGPAPIRDMPAAATHRGRKLIPQAAAGTQ